MLVGSVLDGPPERIPNVALAWAPILYAERAGVIALLITGLGGLALTLLGGGRISSVGGAGWVVEAQSVEADDALGARLTALSDAVDALERRLAEE